MTRRPPLQARIVDAAVELADEVGWPAVRLHQVAARLGVGLPEIRACYPDLDAVADAWLGRADDAMLVVAERADLAEAAAPERIRAALVAWFTALGGRRAMLRAILIYKLQPPHIHLSTALVVATSRRVQWLREAARLDATGRQKSLEEWGLTLLFGAAVLRWLGDRSENFEHTRAFIARRLDRADRLLGRLFG
ncbi:MAG: TetR/AcrR family transcriptional regulator [Alphaproteobacteria bacterium]|jgi:AcrR family transcriptional regulator|nr:TetR/AcrR family transcriptional regulator [Alphaproteobacteria bacterium]MDP6564741.1 TetR/AcrR family transcriptional regulator [Alphaproteobacteria bacterium]MDP6812572.1 TetR/AcrR family transcriptional regulator [Alphaproteobacteria bacterium]